MENVLFWITDNSCSYHLFYRKSKLADFYTLCYCFMYFLLARLYYFLNLIYNFDFSNLCQLSSCAHIICAFFIMKGPTNFSLYFFERSKWSIKNLNNRANYCSGERTRKRTEEKLGSKSPNKATDTTEVWVLSI